MASRIVTYRVFVYEFVTGGGFQWSGESPPESLRREGAAMVAAVFDDFLAAGIEAVMLRVPCDGEGIGATGDQVVEVRTPDEERAAFETLAERADWTLVIAPESDGRLLRCCRRVEAVGGRLLGPGLDLVEMASDKHATAEHLRADGVPVPEGMVLAPGQPASATFGYPAVVKPRYGAGSEGVRLVRNAEEAAGALAEIAGPARLERFYAGQPASVSFLCGPAGVFPLPPCRQSLSCDGRFTYRGGSLPLPAPLAERATALARRAAETLQNPYGYLGIDLVLGDDLEGQEDAIIEMNPRLTTSYIGLRAAAESNLAAEMLAVATGRRPRLRFGTRPVEFRSDGSLL